MDYTQMRVGLSNQFPSRLMTIDSHTAGEPTRLIVGGVKPLPGKTLKEKRLHFMKDLDHIRLQLTREPRGQSRMGASLRSETMMT